MHRRYDCILAAGHRFDATEFKDPKAFEVLSMLHRGSVLPALLASHLATQFLKKSGLLIFTGSYQVLKDSQNGMGQHKTGK